MTPTDPFKGDYTSLPTFEGGRTGEGDRPFFQSNSGGQPPRLLVVESVRSTREILSLVLKERYQIESVATYEEALRHVQSSQFDGVLLSVSRSRFQSGLQTIREIRSTEDYSEIPLLIVTGPNLGEDQTRLREAGGDAFLEMPFVESELLDLLERHLRS